MLLEGASSETDLLLEGRTSMHAPEIDGKVFVNDYPGNHDPADHVSADYDLGNGNGETAAPREGEFYRCRITAAHDYDLVAEII